MPKFYYRAKDRQGEIIEGAIDATNLWLARKALTKINLIPLEVSQDRFKLFTEALSKIIEPFRQKVTLEEQLVMMSQFETGVSVGIPIVQILNLLQQDLENKFLKKVLNEIASDVTEGSSLHEAFAKHPKVFSPSVVGLIKTGELSGKLDETLARITTLIEQQTSNQAKVKSAVFYPKIVLVVMFFVLTVVILYVIPKLKAFLASFGAELPPITKFVMGTSDFFVNYWYLILGFSFAVRQGYVKYISTPQGKYQVDVLKLKMPIFGKIFLFLELNNLCVILELLISSGHALMDALETLKESQKNELFKEALGQCQAEISKGGTLTKAMTNTQIFPLTFKNLISIGEESGRLQPVLKRLGKYYQVQIDYRLDNLSKLIEPVLLVFIFGIVLVIALAVFLPIWKLNAVIRPH